MTAIICNYIICIAVLLKKIYILMSLVMRQCCDFNKNVYLRKRNTKYNTRTCNNIHNELLTFWRAESCKK